MNDSAERLDGRNMTFRATTLPLVWLVTTAGLVGLWLDRRGTGCGAVWLFLAYFTAVGIATVAPPRLRRRHASRDGIAPPGLLAAAGARAWGGAAPLAGRPRVSAGEAPTPRLS